MPAPAGELEEDSLAFVDEVALPPGVPADSATAKAIQEMEWQFAACYNAGDFRRASALWTKDLLHSFLFPLNPDDIASLTASPTPLSEPHEKIGLDVRGVRILPDGRLGAVVDWCGEVNLHIYTQVEGRWLTDREVAIGRPAVACLLVHGTADAR
jgi:hypothetical protein